MTTELRSPTRKEPQLLVIPDGMKMAKENIKISPLTLGEGGFAKVVLALLVGGDDGNEMKVAVKVMSKADVSKSSFTNLQNEIDICAQLSHPCLINTHGIVEDDDQIMIVMDVAEGGELFKYMKKFGLEDMPQVAPSFVAEVVLGLEYMRTNGVIHRDIKPENLLLTSEYHVKIADFGTVCRVTDDDSNKFTGTAQYVSPEVVNTGKASFASDLWALGCVVYQMFVGRPPFQGESQYLIMQNIKARKFEFPPYFPADARDLVDKLLSMDPKDRLEFEALKQHAFFKNVNWEETLTKSNITHLNADYNKKWAMFLLPNEQVMYCSTIVKERYKAMSVKKRILILTDFPRLFYLDPESLEVKGQVPWTDMMCAQADAEDRFHVYTPDRTYHFVDEEKRANLWSARINDQVKQKKKVKK